MEKLCANCGQKFSRPHSSDAQWAARKYCSSQCNGDAIRQPITERFFARFIPEPNSGCWLWEGARGSFGHGQITELGVSYKAHRVSWELHNGTVPSDLDVLHRCDTPACVNPAHLFLGTQADNNDDMWRKGRARGTAATFAKADKCTSGHPFDERNTYRRPKGGRACKICQAERSRRFKERRRLARSL